METIPVLKFKATCLAVLQRVNRTGRPVLVTRFGEPIAEVIRPQRPAATMDWLAAMSGRARITGDVIGPAAGARDWAAMRRRSCCLIPISGSGALPNPPSSARR